MSEIIEITKDHLLPLPDTLCAELGFAVGDILFCELDKERSEIRMVKHCDQTLTDEQIIASGNLTRVIKLSPDECP